MTTVCGGLTFDTLNGQRKGVCGSSAELKRDS